MCLCAHNYRLLYKDCRCFCFNLSQYLEFYREVTPAWFPFFISPQITLFLFSRSSWDRADDLSQLHKATTVLSIIVPKSAFWDIGTAHPVQFVSPHKSLVFPVFGFAGGSWCCLGLGHAPGWAPKLVGCALLSLSLLWARGYSRSFKGISVEIPRSGMSASAMRERRSTFARVQPRSVVGCHASEPASRHDLAAGRAAWVFLPSVSGFRSSSSSAVSFHTPFVALCTTIWPLIAPAN